MIPRSTITVRGEQYPVIFTMGTASLFCKRKGIEMWQFDQIFYGKDPDKLTNEYFDNFADLILCGIENGMHEERKEMPDLDRLDILNWMSDKIEERQAMMAVFYGVSPQGEKKEEPAKKKRKGIFRKS